MDITMVKVYPVQEDKLKAFVSVVFDHCFMVNDIKIIQGREGLFLSMPSRRKKSGEFKDVAHPLNNGTRRMLEERVLEEYRSVADDPTPRRPDRQPVAASAPATLAAAADDPEPAPGRPDPGLPDHGLPDHGLPDHGLPDHGAADPRPAAEAPMAAAAEKTLEEVQELHLSDSFWSVS